MLHVRSIALSIVLSFLCLQSIQAQSLELAYESLSEFGERIAWHKFDNGVRMVVDEQVDSNATNHLLLIFATPNGNSIEETFGSVPPSGEENWRFDIQHVAAQVRQLRELQPNQKITLVIIEAPGLSWPGFRKQKAVANAWIMECIETLKVRLKADRVCLSGHSGGGSFIFGAIESRDAIPAWIERIILLDANYAFAFNERHGDKLMRWLRESNDRNLVVIAYDDREIALNGSKVVGPDGGTYRASERMISALRRDTPLHESANGEFRQLFGLDGRIAFRVHRNSSNKILHTALVGEMNGLIQGVLEGSDAPQSWGAFGGPRSYNKYVSSQPIVDPEFSRGSIAVEAPARMCQLPERRNDALNADELLKELASLSKEDLEQRMIREVLAGNVPSSLRQLVPIRVRSVGSNNQSPTRELVIYVTSDYVSVGSVGSSLRVPLTPASAMKIADATGMTLITPRVSNHIWSAATLRLNPQPMTKDRESLATFVEHQRLIEAQIRQAEKGIQPDPVLIAGIKKDVVWANALREKPDRVAIYGWHYKSGRPIQNVYAGHIDWYVDYSHGIRLMSNTAQLDGVDVPVAQILKDPKLCDLLSDEGPIDLEELEPIYRK